MLSSKHKSIKINNTETKYLRQLRIITKPNLASMLPIKWQESTALNQNPIDGLCMFFFNILDVAGINVWILYKETNGQNISRQQFLLQIVEELAEEYHEFPQEEREDVQY
ncbi:hypothetical protein HZH66_014283 [Vespula vulgaris]|uniref:Uncharacterized protein n=1 Tax=Vespula vulgaris TaxID=7454 RepID=A0A834J5D0_VESVU|nr:hypothetical protein HZH66_014283 [Vespula vulgaris]